MTTAQIIAGTEAKRIGHLNEQRICDWLNTKTAGHVLMENPRQSKTSLTTKLVFLTVSNLSVRITLNVT